MLIAAPASVMNAAPSTTTSRIALLGGLGGTSMLA